MSEKRIGFITYKDLPTLTPGDQSVLDLLAAEGCRTETLIWDDPAVNWGAFDCLVLRSTWDYHNSPAKFTAWLDDLETSGARLWNPAAVVRWNMEKGYLLDLEAGGVAIAPTCWLPRGDSSNLKELLNANRWEEAVVKPVVSASATDTWVTSPEEADGQQARLDALLAEKAMIVQAFMPQIKGEGEWSLMFFNGEFSHAALKRPGADDFRVQMHFGGQAEAVQAPEHLVRQAAEALALSPEDVLYARVDGLNVEGVLVLMELELIEPYLFLETNEGAAARFADAIRARLDEK